MGVTCEMHSTDVSVLLFSSNKIVTVHLVGFKNISKSASNKKMKLFLNYSYDCYIFAYAILVIITGA